MAVFSKIGGYMLGAVIGDIVGSTYEIQNEKNIGMNICKNIMSVFSK